MKQLIPASPSVNISEPTPCIDILLNEYNEKLKGITHYSEFAKDKDELLNYFCVGNANSSYLIQELFKLEGAKAALDAEYWSKTIEMTDILQCMPADKRNNWSEMIQNRKTPAFDRTTVINTITDLLLRRESFLAEKVDGLFRKLSGNHVTNSPMAFREKMIIECVLDSFGYINHSRVEYIHDLRCIIAKLSGNDEIQSKSTYHDLSNISREKDFGKWHSFDNDSFRLKIFKKGTAHLEISEEIAIKLNKILASIHPSVIATSKHKPKKQKESKSHQRNVIVPVQVREILAECFTNISTNSKYLVYICVNQGTANYSRENIKLAEDILEFIGGNNLGDSIFSFDYNCSEVLKKIAREGLLPEQKSHGLYQTPRWLAEKVVDLSCIDEKHSVLEPSAGHGNIASLLPAHTVCVEINSVNAEILKQKGYEVHNEDFLKWDTSARFDRIVMNPPFANNDAVLHIQKASELLSMDGRIVAIVPASLKNKIIVEGKKHTYSENINNAFEGTGVSVVIVEIY